VNVIKEAKKPLVSLIVLFVLSVGIDQGTKQWALHGLLDESFHAEADKYPVCGDEDQERARARFVRRHQENVTVVDGLFDFRYVENCASAFGMMGSAPEWFRFPFFIVVSAFAAFFIPYLYRKTPASQRLMLYAMPFVLGGAVGNLLDRVIYRYVIDFVDWYVVIGGVDRHWPTFNVADAAIVIGIGLMLLQLLPRRKRADAAAS
jgi:lipoprotein signal peptidase